MNFRPLLAGLVLSVCAGVLPAAAQPASDTTAFRALYKELVEINTTLSVGSCTQATQVIATHLKAAGYPDRDVTLIPSPGRPKDGSIVAVLPGTDKKAKAILMLGHLDVVEAKAEDWINDPFKLVEKDGYFYGRGTNDMKSIDAIWIDNLIRYKKEGYKPKRTIKMALTCGEETSPVFDGANYLAKNHHALIDAAFALNEGAGGKLDKSGKHIFNGVQAGEKIYQNFTFEVTNPGGHSSRPVKINAIYQLADALKKVQAYEFPIEFNSATRAFFERSAALEAGQAAADMKAILQPKPDAAALARITADPSFNSILRTTCVATMVDAGHAPNALPQRATANVNCRILPGHKQDEVLKALTAAVSEPAVKISYATPPEVTAPPPPLTKAVMGPIEALTAKMWPGVPVIPIMSAGATDGRWLTPTGIPTYGVSGIFNDPETSNAHGLNERVPVQALYDGRDFLYQLVKDYAGGK